MNCLFTDNLTVVKHLHNNVALNVIQLKGTICIDCSKRSVSKFPRNSLGGDFSRATRRVNTFSGNKTVCSRCIKVVFAINYRMIKLTGSLSLRNKNHTVNGCSLGAVRRNRAHSVGGFAFTLRNKGRRSTTIAVNSIYATKSEHHFAHLIVGKTCRRRSVSTVNLTEHKCAVSLNADHRTRCIGRSTFNRFGL